MEFIQLARKRYSVRKFDGKEVEKEKLLTILEAGRVAPSAHNFQPNKILVIQTTDGLEKLKRGYHNIYGAPLALIICADHEKSWKREYDGKDSADIDASIVTDHMMLCATDLGLGCVWICAFDPIAIRKEFNIPEQLEPVNILLLGYAACEPKSPLRHNDLRKSLDETVVYDSF